MSGHSTNGKKVRKNFLEQKQRQAVEATAWAGYLLHLSGSLRNLPRYKGVAYIGSCGSRSLTEMRRHYKNGQLLYWETFRSASCSADEAKAFVRKRKGVIFRITLRRSGGLGLGSIAYLPACDGEIILLPQVPFVVKKEPYVNTLDGYTYIDIREMVT
jgi:hypothetical protein